VLSEERAEGLDVSEGHNPSFYGAARAWCGGSTMADISDTIDLSEGDLVLTFNKTIDLMRQVREMLADVNPSHPLHETLGEAIRLMKRDIVEQSLMLGFVPISLPEPAAELEPEPHPPPPPRSRTRASRRPKIEQAAAPEPKPRPGSAPAGRRRKSSDGAVPKVEKPTKRGTRRNRNSTTR
jgi:hypothetical protein